MRIALLLKYRLFLVICLAISACSEEDGQQQQTTDTVDTNTPDTNTPDTNTPDTNTPDTNTPDTEPDLSEPVCGNGTVEQGEACDDANDLNNDACVQCANAFCGDGLIQDNVEICDDANAASGDGCSDQCGVELGFACQGEPSVCISTCGDGISSSQESCDDANTLDGDYCNADCSAVTGSCGDNITQINESCDDGNTLNDDFCAANCQAITGFCGDGILQNNETCDDGNSLDDDYCSANCQQITGSCGDSITQLNEACDDANSLDGDYCSANCQQITGACGDGLTQPNETCDDGNSLDGDGCLASCTGVEPGWSCSTDSPSICTPILCAENQYVQNHVCVNCPAGTLNTAGDDASSTDTACVQDPCYLVLGVLCADFEQAYTKASNPDASDNFGWSIALDGDTLAIGAHVEDSNATGANGNQADNSATGSGAVYVFTRSGTTWTQQAYLKASNTRTGAQFGYSLALDGDTLAVGAYNEASSATGVNGDQTDTSVPGSGAVYVFTRTGTDWTQQAYIKASNTDAGDNFGGSIALSGDTLAVGAADEMSNATGVNGNQADNSLTLCGAVYVFTRTGTDWAQQAYIKASNTGSFDGFGYSVALDGDTLAVGAFNESSNATGINGDQANNAGGSSGAVYVFVRTGTTWTQQAYVKPSNSRSGAQFGISVVLDGETLAVGAIGESSNSTGINGDQTDGSAFGSGAAYVFTRAGTTWTQQAYIKASNSNASDAFGGSIALDGDTLAVGAYNESGNAISLNGDQSDNSALYSGAVYVFTRTGTTWTQKAYIKASNTDAQDRFGRAVAVSGNTLVIGAYDEDSSATSVNGDQTDNSLPGSGAIYIRQIAP